MRNFALSQRTTLRCVAKPQTFFPTQAARCCAELAIMKELIDLTNVPTHLAVIMDGNGRWAKQAGAKRIFGHQNATRSVRETVEGAAELNVRYLTLFAFSTENWLRPKQEVNALMELLMHTLKKDTLELVKNNIRLNAIGNLQLLPENCLAELRYAMEKTRQNDGMTLNLALSYSGHWDMVQAVQKLCEEYQQSGQQVAINEENIAKHLTTYGIPEPELLIRTSGEMRISNFMLWQMAYTELYFTHVLWPDFRKEHLYQAILDYQRRERRFGKTSEQI